MSPSPSRWTLLCIVVGLEIVVRSPPAHNNFLGKTTGCWRSAITVPWSYRGTCGTTVSNFLILVALFLGTVNRDVLFFLLDIS